MPKIFPFTAYRYALNQARLEKAVCPPYDVIGAELEKSLKLNPVNAIFVELPEGEGQAKYQNAKDVWQEWKKNRTVAKDASPAFYVYEQFFKVGAKKYSRKGFFCELKVEEPGKGSVLRHELTLAGPKQDRLNLIRTVRINTSPIFGLFSDKSKTVRSALEKTTRKRPLCKVKDPDGVIHSLWSLDGEAEISSIVRRLSKTPVLIADGHHRYETSWNYFQEMKLKEGEDGPSSRMLFFLCPAEDPGLVVFPTHRVLKEKTLDQILDRLLLKKDLFHVEPVKKPGVPKAPSFIVTNGKESFRARLKSAAAARAVLGKKPAPFLNLALNHIHTLLLPELKKEDFTYTHDDREALALAKASRTAAILVPPTTVKEMDGIVRGGEIMPQKSTYFYPKIITGLVFRSLDA